MRAEDVVIRLANSLPLRSDKFTKNVSVRSITRSGTVMTALCDAEHGLLAGNSAAIVGAITPIAISSLTRSGDVGTAVLATKTDLTQKVASQLVISGANEPEFNGIFQHVTVQDSLTLTFDMADAGPIAATGSPMLENGESTFRSYDGLYEVLDAPTTTTFRFAHPIAGLANPIGEIEARTKPRLSAAATLERVVASYTAACKAGQMKDCWGFVVLDDVVASKSRSVRSDAVDNLTKGTEFRQQIIQPFTFYVAIPAAEESLSGRAPRDLAEDLFRPICQSVLFAKLDSGLYVGAQGAVQFVQHGTYLYDSAVYWHAYAFQSVSDITFDDTVGPDVDVAFREIELDMFPIVEGGTGVESMSVDLLLDDVPDPD